MDCDWRSQWRPPPNRLRCSCETYWWSCVAPNDVTAKLEKPALREVAHQCRRSERPGRDLIGVVDPVHQRAQQRRRNRDDIANDVTESFTWREAVLGRREHGAQEKHEAVGVLMVGSDRLRHQIERIAADLVH